jgi:hypothetical protein
VPGPATQAPIVTPAKTAYFIRGATTGLIKIGESIDPVGRLAELSRQGPEALELLAVGGVEREHHDALAQHRVHGEWFTPAPEVLAKIREHGGNPDSPIATVGYEGSRRFVRTAAETTAENVPEVPANVPVVLAPDLDLDLDQDPDQDRETPAAGAARADARSVVRGQVAEVFEHWRTVMGKTQAAKLDDKRRRRIEWGLKGYGLELCKRAIDGCAASPFNMGRNDDGKRYDDIGLIFRDAEKFERFATVGAESGGRRAVVSADVVAGSRPDSAYAEARERDAKVAKARAEAVAPPVDLARLLKNGIGRAMP